MAKYKKTKGEDLSRSLQKLVYCLLGSFNSESKYLLVYEKGVLRVYDVEK